MRSYLTAATLLVEIGNLAIRLAVRVWSSLGRGGSTPPDWWGPIMSRVIALLACGFSLAACSSSLPSMDFFKSSPTTEALRIESEPPGAEAKIASGQSCRTPCELNVKPGADLIVTVALNGYQPQTVPLRQESGDTGKLAPNPVYVDLKTIPPVTPKKKKAAAKKRKPATTAAAPASAPAPSTTTASVPPPDTAPAPAPTEPSPASTTAYPWPSR